MFVDQFVERHIGPDDDAVAHMLEVLGYRSLEDLLKDAVPEKIRDMSPVALADGLTEQEAPPATCPGFSLKSPHPHPRMKTAESLTDPYRKFIMFQLN